MLTPQEATKTILNNLPLLPPERVPLAQAAGRYLRQEIQADRDLPPYDRVMMDGVAIGAADARAGTRRFKIVGSAPAGAPRKTLRGEGACMEVMTGAVMPEGADCVVPVERLEIADGHATLADDFEPDSGLFVHRQGSDFSERTTLVPLGTFLSDRVLGVAASCGVASPLVSALPDIIVLSTGDELVEVGEPVQPHQIRRSNAHAVAAALSGNFGLRPALRHLPDDARAVEEGLAKAAEEGDALILSGGISKGAKDFVPAALERIGLRTLFQGVAQRPGKPLLFGLLPGDKPVFALPGNPVSTLVCLHRYVLPALRHMQGALEDVGWERLALAEAFPVKAPLSFFLPVKLAFGDDGHRSGVPRPVSNSGDYAALVDTDGFVELPGHERSEFRAGEAFPYIPW